MQSLEFLDERGLPCPETNQWIEGFEVDCVWRGRRIAPALDGRAFHDAQQAFDSDRARDLPRLLGVSAATLAP